MTVPRRTILPEKRIQSGLKVAREARIPTAAWLEIKKSGKSHPCLRGCRENSNKESPGSVSKKTTRRKGSGTYRA